MTSDRSSRAPGAISPMAWAIMGLMAAYLAANLFVRSQTPLGGYHPPWVPDVVETAAIFGLAAALVLGGDRWAAGRTWMRRAVPLLAVAGILAAVGQGHLAWILADPSRIGEGIDPLLLARSVLEVAALAAGLACIAIGLWVSRPAVTAGFPVARWVVLPIVAVGLIGVAAEGVYGIAIGLRFGGDHLVGGVTWTIGAVMAPVALTFVAIAALAHRPLGTHLPELGIAVGSVLALAAAGVRSWTAVIAPSLDIDPGWWWLAFGVPSVAGAAGWLTIAGAVALGWWSDRRSRPAPASLAVDGA